MLLNTFKTCSNIVSLFNLIKIILNDKGYLKFFCVLIKNFEWVVGLYFLKDILLVVRSN
jgi:hypothetical protein